MAASRSTSSTTNGVPPSVPSDGASTATPAPGDPPVAETGGDTDAMCVDVSSPAVDPVPQHEGVAATGASRARKRTEAGLASPPPIAQARRGGPGPSPIRPCASGTMGGPFTAVFVRPCIAVSNTGRSRGWREGGCFLWQICGSELSLLPLPAVPTPCLARPHEQDKPAHHHRKPPSPAEVLPKLPPPSTSRVLFLF